MNGRERVLNKIKGKPTDSLPFMPITMMFAADRAGVKYYDYVTDYRVLVETQIRIAEEFDHDFVSGISDPARESADCGAAIEFYEDRPPSNLADQALLADKTKLAQLKVPDPLGGGRMHDRVKAMALFKEKVGKDKWIEGWVEGPCAEAADLRGINTLMLDFYEDPIFVRDMFDFIYEMEMQFAKAQIDAGADIIGIGDAASSLIGPNFHKEIIWDYQKKWVDGIHAMGGYTRLHICGNTRHILEGMGKLGCAIVDLDYLSPVSEAREQMGPDQVILGNIEPVGVLRNGTPESVHQAIAECHKQAGANFIVSAGCEVVRDTPIENYRAMRDYAREH